jgi:Domain of unknown function (DUF4258)
MKKAFPYILIAALGLALYLLKNYENRGSAKEKREDTRRRTKENTTDDNKVNRDNGFDRTIGAVDYTQHAKCRMDCRHISQEEVMDILKNGTINYRKSFAKGKPCPTYALEGNTQKDNQHVRIVFAQCDTKTKVVTCIDLDNDFTCHCPGDDKK